jgi:hypothetical protein
MTDAMTYFRAGDDVPAYLVRQKPRSADHKYGTVKFRVGCTAVTVGAYVWLLPDDPEVGGGIIAIDDAERMEISAGDKSVVFGVGCTVLGATNPKHPPAPS